jgi:hypothetical protein
MMGQTEFKLGGSTGTTAAKDRSHPKDAARVRDVIPFFLPVANGREDIR